ncbi:MAG: magnesium transporter [Candidatus Hydrogenedentota bacterium]|uniref:Magnesium transporter MgtE n=1 Tax=Sumerlaea chitinivorans TaxID=2250252 RepID=A0A2Z4Y755_SUMC1|nr:Mg/Co/Ni transporter MgtE / CBS domain [Candidatus Sumerlaea chitinivorans]RMH24987.1 MAG: magnesium transporter [Candidatus Hydrogenedentota bacterium]
MLGYLLKPEIEAMIREGDFASLRSALEDIPPADLADALSDLSPEDSAVVFRILPRQVAAEAFEYLPIDRQEKILKALGDKETGELLDAMSPDDRTRLLEELPASVTRRLLTLLSPEELKVAQRLLGYPEDSVGRRMTPDYLAVPHTWTVGEALRYIRENGRKSETLSTIYVVDEQGRLVGDASIADILLAPDNESVAEVMNANVRALSATDDQEKAIDLFSRERREALPVVDSEGCLIGIVTIDDILDVAQEEATEDIQKLGAVEALDEPYLQISFWRMLKKRAGWLVVLFLSEMLTATAMSHFEDEIARAVVLAVFVPLIISSGGNSGSQAATLVIRAMALGELTVRDWWRVVRREVASGLALGSILGTIGFLRITLWSLVKPDLYGPHWALVALTVGIALVGVVLWGCLAGSMLPIILKRLGFDPAASSAPFVATLVDVTGIVIYFTVASFILRGTLL